MWIHLLAEQVSYTRMVEKCRWCVLCCVFKHPLHSLSWANFQKYLGNKAKDPKDFPNSCFRWQFLDTFHSQCTNWWYKFVVCSMACCGRSLCTFTQPPNHWKKLDFCEVFSDMKVQSETCLWQQCWASVIFKHAAALSLQCAPRPGSSSTEGHLPWLEGRQGPLLQIIRRSGLQSVLWVAWS